MSYNLLDLYAYEVFNPPVNITGHIMLRLRYSFSVCGDCMFPDSRILRKVDLELYIPGTICVFGGTPFKCLAWLSSI